MRAVLSLAIAALSGCSLFLDESAGGTVDSCERPECPTFTVESSIGPIGEFRLISDWLAARAGDLANREVIAVTDLEPGELAAGTELRVEGCYAGLVVSEPIHDGELSYVSVDSAIQLAPCERGTPLVDTGASFAGLVGIGVIEKGVAEPGRYTENLVFDSITSRASYLWLTTTDEGRHLGVSGGGVVLEGSDDRTPAIQVHADHSRIEWIEIDNWRGNGPNEPGIAVEAHAVEIHRVMLADSEPPFDTAPPGIEIEAGAPVLAIISNTVIRNIAGSCITVADGGHQVQLINSTIVGCWRNNNESSVAAIEVAGASEVLVENVISVGSGLQSYGPNVDGDTEVPNCFHDEPATPLPFSEPSSSADLFANPSGDLVLSVGSAALGAGAALADDRFAEAIDGTIRTDVWNAGAY